MASLNTLRTKGGWFLSIVIMLALLAFILSDFVGQGRGQNPIVGTINGVKVRYMDFINERQRQEGMVQGSGEEAQEAAYQRAWSELVSQNALMPGFYKMGLAPSEAEQSDMVSGMGGGYISPIVEQSFTNPQTGAFDPQALAEFVGNMTPTDRATWQMILRQADQERMFSKYGMLVANGLYVNDIEVEKAVDAENNSYDARIVFKPYSSIADSTVAVSQSEIKKYYNTHKKKFQRDASRDIEYVVFDILPSEADVAEARKHVDGLASEFAAAADPAMFASLNSDDKTPATFVRESTLDSVMIAAFNHGEMYGPVLNGETFTMARIAERRSIPDSVSFGTIILPGDHAAEADSLLGIVTTANFTELARIHSEDRQSQLAGGATVTLDPLGMTPELTETLLNTPAGRISKVESGGYIFILNVVGKSVPVSKIKVAEIEYAVRTSAATHAEVTKRAREFYDVAKESTAAFDKAVSEMSLAKRTARIADTDREVDGLENSLSLVRWAYSGKKGTIMEPEELSRDYVIVAALTDIAEAGTSPLEEVSSQIRSLLVQRKKGDILAETMTGASIDAVAAANSLEVVETSGLQFSAFMIPEVGFEPRLIGAICSAKQANAGVSKPVRGTNGVYVFEVTDITSADNADAEGMRVRLESMQQYMMNAWLMNALYKKSDIVDLRAKYF